MHNITLSKCVVSAHVKKWVKAPMTLLKVLFSTNFGFIYVSYFQNMTFFDCH